MEEVQLLTSAPLGETAVSVPAETIALQVSGQRLATSWGGELYLPLDERPQAEAQSVQLIAIPYFLWGNRGMNSMRIWVPQAQ
ncbi:MAG: hypothetical protein KDE51_02590 [Anaerolineales bacterium]|nr:hypothetical protein [Anaerolineales bacterium]